MWSGFSPEVSWITLKLVGVTVPCRTDWFTRKKSYLENNKHEKHNIRLIRTSHVSRTHEQASMYVCATRQEPDWTHNTSTWVLIVVYTIGQSWRWDEHRPHPMEENWPTSHTTTHIVHVRLTAMLTTLVWWCVCPPRYREVGCQSVCHGGRCVCWFSSWQQWM